METAETAQTAQAELTETTTSETTKVLKKAPLTTDELKVRFPGTFASLEASRKKEEARLKFVVAMGEKRRAERLSQTREGRIQLAAEGAKKQQAAEEARRMERLKMAALHGVEAAAATMTNKEKRRQEREKAVEAAKKKKADQAAQGRFAGERKASK